MDISTPKQQNIFLEGLSCSGKTTALSALALPNTDIIYKEWPANVGIPTTEFFLERDQDKLSRASASSANLVLVDRGYLSTLAFYTVLEEITGVSAYPVYKWFVTEIGNSLFRPDYYIFVDIPPAVSLARAQEGNRVINENNMWLKFPERIEYWYNRLLEAFDPSVLIYRIDGNQPKDVVVEELRSILLKIQQES